MISFVEKVLPETQRFDKTLSLESNSSLSKTFALASFESSEALFSPYFWSEKRGCCIRSPLVTKLFEVVLLHEDVTQPELKKSSPLYTCDLSLHRVSALSVHYF